MTVRFERSEETAIEACVDGYRHSALYRRSWRASRLRFALLTGYLPSVATWFGLRQFVSFQVALWGLLGVLAVGAFAGLFLFDATFHRHAARLSRRAWRLSGVAPKGKMRVSVTEDGVHSQGELTESVRKWAAIRAFIEGERYFLFLTPEGVLEVPRTAFATPADAEAFARVARGRGSGGTISA